MGFEDLVTRAQGYRKLRAPSPGGGLEGPTPLNLRKPVGTAELEETQQNVQRRAADTANAQAARGLTPPQRVMDLATGESAPPDPLESIWNVLTYPMDVIRLSALGLFEGGVEPTRDDYVDVMTLNKQRMIARNQADPNSQWGRTGEYRGTDQLEDMGVPYVTMDQKGPWDEIRAVGRGVLAGGLDIFEDPISLVTGGGAGVARHTALRASETVTTKVMVQARNFLRQYGDDALDVVVKEVAEEGTSPLLIEAAEQMQRKGRTMVGKPGWEKNVQGAIDEVSGIAGVDELTQGVIDDMAKTGADAIEDAAEKAMTPINNVTPKFKDVFGESTVWADITGEVGDTVTRKLFHNRSATWNAYSKHILYHSPDGSPTLLSTIGGLQFQIPFDFTGRSARSFGKLSEVSRGFFTRATRGQRFGAPFTKISESGPVFKTRSWWQKYRGRAGKQQDVMALRHPFKDQATRRAEYVRHVAMQYGEQMIGDLLNPIRTTVLTSNIGRQMIKGIHDIAGQDDELAAEIMRRIYVNYGKAGADITRETFADLAVEIPDNVIAYMDHQVKAIWKLHTAGSEAYARFDAEFGAAYHASDKTYTPLVIADGVAEAVETNRWRFDAMMDEWEEFVRGEGKALSPGDRLNEFARRLGADLGVDISDAEFVQMYDFINSFKAIKNNPGLQAIGDASVTRLRSLGNTARVQYVPTENGLRLKVTSDFAELAAYNEKLTLLINRYLPDQYKLTDVFETNPAALLEHWMSQIHSAVSERMLTKFMYDSGIVRSPEFRAFNLDDWLDRQARSGATQDMADVAQSLLDLMARHADGEAVDEVALRNVIGNKQIPHVVMDVGGLEVSVQSAAYYDPAFQTAVKAADDYLSTLKEETRHRVAKLLAQEIGKIQASGKTAQEVHNILHRHLSDRFRSHRYQMLKSLKENTEKQFSGMEEAAMIAGRPLEELQILLDKKNLELERIDQELGKLDLAHAELAEKAVNEAMASAPNAEANDLIASQEVRPKGKNKHDKSAKPITLKTAEDFEPVVDGVISHREAKISQLYEVRDAAPQEERFALSVEANEYRRVAEGIEDIPVEHVTRAEGAEVTDAGWVVPAPDEAHVWLEYLPGFGGGGNDFREGGGNIAMVWPEGKKQGAPADEFARKLGWTGNGQTVKQWYKANFLRIGHAVWKFQGNSPIPFYVLSAPGGIEESILRDEFTYLWHQVNQGAGVKDNLVKLKIYGLEGTGLSATAEHGISEEMRLAIKRIRQRRPGQARGQLRSSSAERRAVPSFEVFLEELHQRAIKLSKKSGIPLEKAFDELRQGDLLGEWLEAMEFAMIKPPQFMRRVQTRGRPLQAFNPEKPKKPPKATYLGQRILRPEGDAIVDDVTGMEYLTDTNIIERIHEVDNPNAHKVNQYTAKTNGVDGWEELSPRDLEHTLRYNGLEALPTFEQEVGQFVVSYDNQASRSAGARFEYDEQYLEWLQYTAAQMGITPKRTVEQAIPKPKQPAHGDVFGEHALEMDVNGQMQMPENFDTPYVSTVGSIENSYHIKYRTEEGGVGTKAVIVEEGDTDPLMDQARANTEQYNADREAWKQARVAANQGDVTRAIGSFRELTGLAVDHPAIWELEDAIESFVNIPMNLIYFRKPFGYEALPPMTPDLEHVVRGGYRQVFPQSDQEINPFMMMMRLRGRNWRPDAEDMLAIHEEIPQYRIGETTGVTDRIMDFLSDERMEGLRVHLVERVPEMERTYRKVIQTYRDGNQPRLLDDDPYWDWLEGEYPGIMDRLRGVGQRQASVRLTAEKNIQHEAGVELLELEKRFALGPPPSTRGGPASQAMFEYNKKLAEFRSGFVSGSDPSPSAAWKNFYDKLQGQTVHNAFLPLVNEYEQALREIRSPEMLEGDILAEVLNLAVLPEEAITEDVTYTLVNILAENEGDLRQVMELSDPVKGSPHRDDEIKMTGNEWDQLTDEEIGPIGREMRRLKEDSWLGAMDEEASKAERYLDDVDLDDGEQWRPLSAAEERRTKTYNAGIRSRAQNLIDIVTGDSFLDMDALEIDQFDERFFTKYYEPLGSVPLKGDLTYEVIDSVDVSQGANLPSMDVPVDPATGRRLVDSDGKELSFMDRREGGQDPSGIDPTVANEFGELQRIGLDPRSMHERIEKPWRGEIVVSTQKKAGPDQVNLGFGENVQPRAVVEKYNEHQAQIEEMMTGLRFSDSPMEITGRKELSEELVKEGTALLDTLFATNSWHRHGMSVAGVNPDNAEQAWARYQVTRHPAYLMDEDLIGAFGYAKGLLTLKDKDPKTWERAVRKAMMDVPPENSAQARLAVRRMLDSEFKPLVGDAETLERARGIRGTTQAVPASNKGGSTLFKDLTDIQREARRKEKMLGARPGSITERYAEWAAAPIEQPAVEVPTIDGAPATILERKVVNSSSVLPTMEDWEQMGNDYRWDHDEYAELEAQIVAGDIPPIQVTDSGEGYYNLQQGIEALFIASENRINEVPIEVIEPRLSQAAQQQIEMLEFLGPTERELYDEAKGKGTGTVALNEEMARRLGFPVPEQATDELAEIPAELATTEVEVPAIDVVTRMLQRAEQRAPAEPVTPTRQFPGANRVISGGQKGADILSLQAGRKVGMETGGTAPKGWFTSKGGPTRAEMEDFGLVEDDSLVLLNDDDTINVSDAYRMRTLKNVMNSDGTILLTVPGKSESPGSQLTRYYATGQKESKRPFLHNPTLKEVREWVEEHGIKTINMAGNREYEDIDYIEAILRAASGADTMEEAATVSPRVAAAIEPEIGGAVNVGRHSGKEDNWGSPFYVLSDRETEMRWKGKLHPWYKRRVVEGGTWEDVVAPEGMTVIEEKRVLKPQAYRKTTVESEPSVRWEPVPYAGFKTQAEADAAYYEMLWDMVDDPEHGPAVRAELVERLHGRVLFKYAEGKNARSRTMDAQILADTVDWIASGVYDATRDVNFTGVGPRRISGRPTRKGMYPYATFQETKLLDRIAASVDRDAVREMYDRHTARMAPVVEKEVGVQEERLVQQLVDHPEFVDFILSGKPVDYKRAQSIDQFTEEVKAIAAEMIPFFEKMGISEYTEMLTNLDHAMRSTQMSPLMMIITQAARRAGGPRARLKPLKGGGFVLEMPGSPQNAHLAYFDRTHMNAETGWTAKDPPPLSLTFKQLDEMGEEKADELGMELPYQMSQTWAELRTKRDALLSEIDRIKGDMEQRPTSEALEAASRSRTELDELDDDLNVLTRIMNKAWKTSMDGENASLRTQFNMPHDKGALPSGDHWEAYLRALERLSPKHRNNVEFLVDSALVADLFTDFPTYANWWKGRWDTTRQISGALEEMLSEVYRKAEQQPLLWDQAISLGPIKTKMLESLLDAAQILKMHAQREGDEDLYSEVIHRIGLTTTKTVDDRYGSNVLDAGQREEALELINTFIHTTEQVRHSSPMQLLANVLNDDTLLKQMDHIVESFKVRREEFVDFGKGVPGSYFGLAGDIENGLIDELVALEYQRALGRLQLAADPRVGMEIMGGVQKAMAWWTKAATVGRPTFAPRNLIGGLWNNMLDGIRVHETLAMMPDVWHYVRNRRRLGKMELWDQDFEGMIDGYQLQGVSEENKEMMSRAIRAGVMDSAFTSTLPRNVKGAYGFQAWNPFNSNNKYFGWGTEAMEFTEGILRMAVFKHYYDPAHPHVTSRMGKAMVDQLHFDYSDLSAFDKKAKVIAPFWVWTSRNLPLQMRHMLGDPRMLMRYEHVRRNMNDQFRDWEDENSDWQGSGRRWILPFRREDDKGNWVQLSWEPSLPFNDMLETPFFQQTFDDEGADLFGEGAFNVNRWVGWVTGNLAPELSALSDMAIDPRDQFKQTNAPPLFASMFRALGAETTPQGDVRVNPWVNSIITTALPFFNEYASMAGIPSTSPYSAGNQGFLPDEYMNRGAFDARVPFQQMARGLGLHWRSPEDIYWEAMDWKAFLEQEQFMERAARSE